MRSFLLILSVFICCIVSFSKIPVPKDSLHILSDTLRTDSAHVNRDTTKVKGVDTVVTYLCSDSIVYDLSTKLMTMFHKSQIKYQQMQLNSERITVNWNTSILTAQGIPDSPAVGRAGSPTKDKAGSSDSTKKKKYKGLPVMKDGGEEYHGFELGYNFKTKKGRIDVGDTHIDQGFYHGEEIKKVDPDVMFIADGRYTTCDAPEPHFYFASPKMKVTLQDKIIAEPVYFYIADVPVFVLPVGVFPNKGGRRSGIIAPAIVEDATHGRLLHHLGYYWAISDYMDMNVRTDLYTKGSWGIYSDYRYVLRYYFNGSLSGHYLKLIEGERGDPSRKVEESYQFNITHAQTVDPRTSFNVNFTFASNNSYRNTIDLNQALNQSITSNATLSRRFDDKNSTSINISRTQNLVTGDLHEVLPSFNFSHSTSYPFRFRKTQSEEDLAWYEMISVGYGANASNNRSKVKRTVDSIEVDSSFQHVSDYEQDRSQTISQNVSMGIAPRLGNFTIVPSMSYSDTRTFISNDVPVRGTDNKLAIANVKDTKRTGFLTSGLGLSTRLYGLVQPGFLGVSALRHTVTPNLSFTYSKQVVGENLTPAQMVMGLSVGNLFEIKTISSEAGKEGDKIQLLNAGVGISYNFSVDSLNFSPINLNYRTDIGRFLNVGGTANFDLYKLEQTGPSTYTRVNKFLIKEEGRFARLTDFSINLSTSLSGQKKSSKGKEVDTTVQRSQQQEYYGLYREEEPDFSIPWQLSLGFNYSENKVQPSPSRSASIRGNLEFNLTDAWKFTTSGGYDIVNHEVVVPNITVSRDLHCWIMNFSWVPTGAYKNYSFEIRIKAPQLHDIKVTKHGSEKGIY